MFCRSRSSCAAVKRQSRSQLQPVFLDPGRSHARCVQRQLLCRCSCAGHRRFSRPCDHAATFAQWKCPSFSFRRGRWTFQLCNREADSTFDGGEGFFRRILRHFSRSSGCPGVERQFFELSSAHNCECSRAPGVPESPGV